MSKQEITQVEGDALSLPHIEVVQEIAFGDPFLIVGGTKAFEWGPRFKDPVTDDVRFPRVGEPVQFWALYAFDLEEELTHVEDCAHPRHCILRARDDLAGWVFNNWLVPHKARGSLAITQAEEIIRQCEDALNRVIAEL